MRRQETRLFTRKAKKGEREGRTRMYRNDCIDRNNANERAATGPKE